MHRGDAGQCVYDNANDTTDSPRMEDVKSDNQALKERIRRLEDIVQEYARRSDASGSPRTSEDNYRARWSPADRSTSPVGFLGPGVPACQSRKPGARAHQDSLATQRRYKSLASWDHILRELDELKIAVSESIFDPCQADGGADFGASEFSGPLFPGVNQSFESVLAQLPPKHRMDTLLSQYLNSYHPFYPVVNPTQFRNQYQTFLASPTDPITLSLLYGMMALAIANGDPRDRTADTYIKLSLQALQISRFTITFNLTTVVCLINIMFFLQRERGQQTFTWILLGSTLQIARALGLHRDPPHFGITGQECQTRRHVWTALLDQDAIHAARYGRTIVIDVDEWDTKAPDQVNEDGGRITDPPQASYAQTKRMVAITIAKVFKLLLRPRARPSYQTVLDVEKDIRASHASFVSTATTISVEEATDDAEQQRRGTSKQQCLHWLFARYSPFVMAYTLVVIHRPFMVRKTAEALHSRATCLAASRRMLEIVAEMEARPGLEHYAWHVREFANIAHVPSATLLCIGLHIRKNPAFETLTPEQDTVPAEADRRMIEHVLSRLESGSDAHSFLQDLYHSVTEDSSAAAMEGVVDGGADHEDQLPLFTGLDTVDLGEGRGSAAGGGGPGSGIDEQCPVAAMQGLYNSGMDLLWTGPADFHPVTPDSSSTKQNAFCAQSLHPEVIGLPDRQQQRRQHQQQQRRQQQQQHLQLQEEQLLRHQRQISSHDDHQQHHYHHHQHDGVGGTHTILDSVLRAGREHFLVDHFSTSDRVASFDDNSVASYWADMQANHDG